jgi:hypothetical protein
MKLPYFRIILVCAVLLSVTGASLFIASDFQNVHFDSKGHQLVPRRIFDNLSPGWIQIGAFWLPLPHVLYWPLVHSDYFYFHGLTGTPISMLCFIATVLLLFRLIERVFDPFSAFCGSALYMTNPNILYLQSSSLTENLSIFFMVASVFLFVRFVESRRMPALWQASGVAALGILTRYDNWPVFLMMGLLLIIIDLKEKRGWKNLLQDGFVLGVLGFGAMALTFWINWATTGHWTMDITAKYTDFQFGKDSYLLSGMVVLYTLAKLVSYNWMFAALIAFALLMRKRFKDSVFLASLALLGPMILYIAGYHDNHPTRIRYGLELVPACFFLVSYWPGRSRLLAYLFAIYALYVALFSSFYHDYGSQLLLESLRDAEDLAEQRDLLWYLQHNDDGQLILLTMGDLAPVVYDLKLPVKRFIHEGAKPWWNDAQNSPEKVAGWVFLSQDDRLWRRFHDDPEFHKKFELIGRRSHLELYHRSPDEKHNVQSHRPHGQQDKGEIRNLPL